MKESSSFKLFHFPSLPHLLLLALYAGPCGLLFPSLIITSSYSSYSRVLSLSTFPYPKFTHRPHQPPFVMYSLHFIPSLPLSTSISSLSAFPFPPAFSDSSLFCCHHSSTTLYSYSYQLLFLFCLIFILLFFFPLLFISSFYFFIISLFPH